MSNMKPSDAVTIAAQHPYSIVAIFVVGYLLHVGLQIDAVARSKNNPVESRWFIIAQNGVRLAARFFVSSMIFFYMWRNPSSMPVILGYFGITLSPNAIAIMTLPMSPPVAGIMGFAVDSLLAYVPILKNALPAIEFVQVEKSVKETRTVETHSVVVPADPPKEGK